MARATGYREARRSAQCSPTPASPNQRRRVRNPALSGSSPPDPAEPGRWGRSRDGQRGERYGDGRARGTRDAGGDGYRRDRDYEWDRGAGADPGYARADRPRAERPRAGHSRAAGGRNGGSRADERWAAQRGPDQGGAAQRSP